MFTGGNTEFKCNAVYNGQHIETPAAVFGEGMFITRGAVSADPLMQEISLTLTAYHVDADNEKNVNTGGRLVMFAPQYEVRCYVDYSMPMLQQISKKAATVRDAEAAMTKAVNDYWLSFLEVHGIKAGAPCRPKVKDRILDHLQFEVTCVNVKPGEFNPVEVSKALHDLFSADVSFSFEVGDLLVRSAKDYKEYKGWLG